MQTVNTQLVHDSVPNVYADVRRRHSPAFPFDMSESNQCQRLSLGMFGVLEAAGQPVRREMHELRKGSWWHFVIAHSDVQSPPSQDDIITDLNPWQYNVGDWDYDQRTTAAEQGYLHGPRNEVMERLREAGAPEWHVALRGLHTILEPHTLSLTPRKHRFAQNVSSLHNLVGRLPGV